MTSRPYLVAFTAGWGDQRRWKTMALEFYDAVKRASGAPLASLMGGCTKDSLIVRADSPLDAQAFYDSILDHLDDSEFEFTSTNADRLLVVEAGLGLVASDLAVQTAAGMR